MSLTSKIERLVCRWEECKERCEAEHKAWESQIYDDLAAALVEHTLEVLPAVCRRNAAAFAASQHKHQCASAASVS
jgi:hypothetical protein